MATLTVNGTKVKVDDSFLNLPKDQQQAQVNKIAASLAAGHKDSASAAAALPAAPPSDQPPAGAAPGSKEYADWAVARAKAGQALPQVSDPDPAAHTLASQISAGFTSGVNAVPIAGPTLLAGARQLKSMVQGRSVDDITAEDKMLEADNPTAATIGQVTGTVAPFALAATVPVLSTMLGLDSAASLPMQIGAGALSQAGISRADAAIRGETPEQTNQAGLLGLATGMAAPIAGKLLTKTGEAVIKPLGRLASSTLNPTGAAQKIIANAARADSAAGAALAPADELAAAVNGQPLVNADRYGSNVRTLARTAANLDPTAKQVLNDTVGDRFLTQNQRAADWLQRNAGVSTNVHALQQGVEDAARKANKPRYDKAYASPNSPGVLTVPVDPTNPAAGDVLHPDIHNLMQAEPFQQAIKQAVSTGKTDAALHGFPPVQNPFRFNKDGTYDWVAGAQLPTLPFWDQVQRNLGRSAKIAARQGDTQAGPISALRGRLNTALDAAIPEFGVARTGAAAKFGAEDALEAGQNFVKAAASDVPAMAAAHAQFSPAEKKLFASGFTSSMLDKISKAPDTTNVINSVFGSPQARQQIDLALGPKVAAELEPFTRVENIMHMTKQAVQGGPNTAAQLASMGAIGAAGGALSTGDVNPLHWLNPATLARAGGGAAAMMMFGRTGAKMLGQAVDGKVMQTIATALSSSDPAQIQQAVKMAAKSSKSATALKAIEHGLATSLRAGAAGAASSTVAPVAAAQPQLEAVQ